MEFVAIDVETANTSRSSICAFGVVEVVNGEVVNSHRWLSKPPREDTYFDPFITLIHGIRAEDVEDAPSFTASLDRLTAIVGGRPVIGLPGCARSPALNGADWVLERIACGRIPTAEDIAAMGVGGLLKESPMRGQPREG